MTYAFKNYIQNGIGADLVRLTGIKSICDKNNIELCMSKNDEWKHVPDDALYRNWEYYFEPSLLPMDINDEFPKITGEYENYCFKTAVPENMDCSKFVYRSKLMKELYRPQKEFIGKVTKYIDTNLPYLNTEKYIAIHIRRGDKTSGPWKEADGIALERYLSALKNYVQEYINCPIIAFIITDSETVIQEVSQLVDDYKKYNINIKWDPAEIRRDGYSYKLHKFGYSDSERIDEITIFMKNMYIMEHSDKIIGSRMSFFFITGELLRGQKEISLSNNELYPVDFYD